MVSFVGNAFASKIQQKTYNAVTSHDTKALDKLRRVLCVVGTGMKSSKNKSKPKLVCRIKPLGINASVSLIVINNNNNNDYNLNLYGTFNNRAYKS